MAQTINGTGGNDTLAPIFAEPEGIIDGLNGDDSIYINAGVDTVVVNAFGSSGFDTLYSNVPGFVRGGDGNDSIRSAGLNTLFGNFGSDTIDGGDDLPVTIVGGDNSNDGHDSLLGTTGNNIIFGNGGNDTINGRNGSDTLVAGQGNDSIFTAGSGIDLVFGNEGNDTINVFPGNDLIFAGQGNDSVIVLSGSGSYFLNEGNDTFNGTNNSSALTVQGGNDSADGNDSITTGFGADVVLGNGGADTINGGTGNNTLVGGFGDDRVSGGTGADVLFGNQDNDTIFMGQGDGADTVFAGQGNDLVFDTGGVGRGLVLGNEGNDTINAGVAADTITGGAGSDLFEYFQSSDDGNGAAGGPIELITDVNFAEDRFRIAAVNVGLAANAGTGNATTLAQAAANAIDTVWRQNTSSGQSVAAVFSFLGRSYLAVDTFTNGIFQDGADILIDVTGAAGTVSAINFLPG